MEVRKRILQEREAMPAELQREKSLKIQNQVLENACFKREEWIFLYMNYKAEVQTDLLLEECLRQGKKVVLPRVCGSEMDFYRVKDRKDVQPGYFGILEPVTDKKIQINHGFMVVPGVAFTKEGCRMGYGKGFYDRYLERFPGIYTCGLAYDCQIVKQLPVESHDKKLNECITG